MSEANTEKKFVLPYSNTAVDSYLSFAENAYWQAETAAGVCRSAMINSESTMMDIIPAHTELRQDFTNSIVSSTRSLMLTAESAFQAQTSVCAALSSARAALQNTREQLCQRINEVATEIAALDASTASLRQSFAKAADAPSHDESYATNEAKKLLNALETAYHKHDLNRKLHQNVAETDSNISYIDQAAQEAQSKRDEYFKLAKRTSEEWKTMLSLLKLDPREAAAQNDLLLFKDAAAPPPPPPANLPPPPPPAPAMEPIKRHGRSLKRSAERDMAEEGSRSAWTIIWSYIKIIILAFLIAFVLRAYVFDVTMVEGSSMTPTLYNGDYLITSRLSYRLGQVQRGDIVVVNAPDEPGTDYIKRVIGLPGETLIITDGSVYIDGTLLIEPYLDGVKTMDDGQPQVIPQGYYFVLGDNRTDSRDSRVDDIGFISIDDIEGKALFCVLPFSDFGSLY